MEDKILDKLMKPYWDHMFKDSKLGTIVEYDDDDDDWRGIIKSTPNGEELLVGYPYLDIGDTWFSNGPYFSGGWNFFNINIGTYNNGMLRYINNRFNTNIQRIM